LDDGVGGHPGPADAANETVPPAGLPQMVQSLFDALRDGLNVVRNQMFRAGSPRSRSGTKLNLDFYNAVKSAMWKVSVGRERHSTICIVPS